MTRTNNFAPFNPPVIKVKPSIKSYEVDSDLRNVVNGDAFNLSITQRAALVENGFVVVPRYNKQILNVYVENRDKGFPSFITSDVLLHTFHVMHEDTLKRLEEKVFLQNLKILTDTMLRASMEQYNSAASDESKIAAERNLGFFAVAAGILGIVKTPLPEQADKKVKEELRLIKRHAEVKPSPVFGYSEDYTHYIPRGHYESNQELSPYFQCMTWYGRMMFRLSSGESDEDKEWGRGETVSALLIMIALENTLAGGSSALTLWDEIHSTLSFLVGFSDDLNVYDYLQVSRQVFGELHSMEQLGDAARVEKFISEAQKLRKPHISSAVLSTSHMTQWPTITKGFRFIGSRFIPDSYIFMELVHPNVAERSMPTGLDVVAVLGSRRAKEILNDVYQEFSYDKYREQLKRLTDEFSQYPVETWTQNLYWAWLYCLKALLDKPTDGYPLIMLNQAWEDKQLNTALGSWAELRHDVLLYGKQSEALEEEMEEPSTECGYVEPIPEFYSRLAALVRMVREGLEERGLFEKLMPGPEPERPEDTDEDWDTYMERWERWHQELSHTDEKDYRELESILLKLKEISEKELEDRPLSGEEYNFIRDIGYILDRISFLPATVPAQSAEDMSVVADVHTVTSPGNECLEVAVGRAMELYAVVNIKDILRITRGSVFSYYEFQRPIADRMTDAEWRELQEKGRLIPPMPVWARSFVKGGADSD